jgi:hypothetical protein
MPEQIDAGGKAIARRLLAAKNRPDRIKYTGEITETPIMSGFLDDIEPAIGQLGRQMICRARRDDRVVASLPHHRWNVDFGER